MPWKHLSSPMRSYPSSQAMGHMSPDSLFTQFETSRAWGTSGYSVQGACCGAIDREREREWEREREREWERGDERGERKARGVLPETFNFLQI